MAGSIRARIKQEGEYTVVKALIKHPMETGVRKGGDGKPIPAHYIRDLDFSTGGKTVFKAHWGTGIAANPYISFKFKGGKPGDRLTISWTDNLGKSDSLTEEIQ